MTGKNYALDPSSGGFSLIELMITISIIGILAAIAVPSYTGYLERARQNEAKFRLTEIMQAQEGFYTEKNYYTTDLSQLEGNPTTESEYYKLTAEKCTDRDGNKIPIDRCVRLKAEPQGAQAGDDTLKYNSRGVKKPEDLWE